MYQRYRNFTGKQIPIGYILLFRGVPRDHSDNFVFLINNQRRAICHTHIC